MCNGLDNCGDFSDEEMCNVNECEYTDCDHVCKDLKIGYECLCNPGFLPSKNDSHKCEDINECENRPCQQLCLNTYGSFHCECLEGYLKLGNSCKVDSPDHPKLIFTNYFYIRYVNITINVASTSLTTFTYNTFPSEALILMDILNCWCTTLVMRWE